MAVQGEADRFDGVQEALDQVRVGGSVMSKQHRHSWKWNKQRRAYQCKECENFDRTPRAIKNKPTPPKRDRTPISAERAFMQTRGLF